ncbi:putative vanin-like protein 2 isoform X1 [Penaeus vannamei]|uniref:Putative vanin-like protein 2 isoform X1 n=1 Tax=Penaeus vannamei TaxID=6689 RepID=A0A3R7Q2K0_PENVA|nr:putative vanin-like protein 2 isoform X1 [Penaeus vannamei]
MRVRDGRRTMNVNKLWLFALWGITLSTQGHAYSQPLENFDYTSRDEDIVYRAAVVEYRAYDDMKDGGLAVLKENARMFVEYAAAAKQQVIFFFLSLSRVRPHRSMSVSPAAFASKTQALPDPAAAAVLCNSTDTSESVEAVRVLSCAAAELGIYLVVNLAERVPSARECLDSGFDVYNTEVVFDRAGAVVAKYHKKSLYLEPGFTPGSQDDKEAIFTTDFGVTFTLQVCFDVLYPGPGTSNVVERGVKDAIMSSYWVDELPFLTAPQVWQSWSEGLAVNLMVANVHNPEEGALGSGIFRGLTSQDSLYTYDPNSGSKLLVGEVSQAVPEREDVGMGIYQEATWIPTENGDGEAEEKNGQPETEGREIRSERVFLHEDLERYSSYVLERGDGAMERSLCHNDSLCCSVTYSFPADLTDNSSFLLLAYSGVSEKGGGAYKLFTQVCAVVYCLNENVTSCARVEENGPSQKTSFRAHNVTGDFDTSYIYPSVFTQDFKLVDASLWDFESSFSSEKLVKSTLVLHEEVDNLLSLTLFGRWFDRDP